MRDVILKTSIQRILIVCNSTSGSFESVSLVKCLCCLQVKLSEDLKKFIKASTGNYGKAKMVLQKNKFYVESPYPEVLDILLKVRLLSSLRVSHRIRYFFLGIFLSNAEFSDFTLHHPILLSVHGSLPIFAAKIIDHRNYSLIQFYTFIFMMSSKQRLFKRWQQTRNYDKSSKGSIDHIKNSRDINLRF